MKRTMALILSGLLMIGLIGCGQKEETPGDTTATETVAVTDATDLLTQVWNSYDDADKFPIGGGDFDNVVMDAPGKYDVSKAEEMDATLGLPQSCATMIDDAASMMNAMMANNFTAGVYHVTDSANVQAVADGLKDTIMSKQWMCGMPEKMIVVAVDDYVISAFGLSAAIDPFKAEISEVYANATCLVDPAIGEAGDVDTAIINLKFANGAVGVIDNSRRAAYGYDQRIEVFGSKGAAVASNDTPTNVVFMGQGEPLDNFENIKKAIELINKNLQISIRRMTLSTSGIVPKIYELAKNDLIPTLAISLHAPNHQIREQIMPIEKKYNIIELKNIYHSYNEMEVLKGISLTVKKGEILGLLGPSGAGKTTLVNILTGQLTQTAGIGRVLGDDTKHITDKTKAQIGIMMDSFGLYQRLTVYDNMQLFGEIYKVDKKKIEETLKKVGLYNARKTTVSNLSKGMRNRLNMARAILAEIRPMRTF